MKIAVCDYLITSKEIAEATGLKESGIRQTYVHQESKQGMLKAMGMGSMCIHSNISPTKLKNIIDFHIKQEEQILSELRVQDGK